MTFIRNAWYMIAWSDEVKDVPLARTVLEIPIVVYRDPASSKPVAMMDRCPHRFAPLSVGVLKGSNIQCGYHGLEFDPSGRCVRNPFSKAVPAAAKVRVFPVAEQDRILWIWMGAEQAADLAAIPTFAHHTSPEHRCVHGHSLVRADYRLLSDNLMDLTHSTFLHPQFGGEAYTPKVTCWDDADGSIVADFTMDRIHNFVGQEAIPSEFIGNHDRMRWQPPGLHWQTSRVWPAEDRSTVHETLAAHILTPESARSTHYFWSSAVDASSPLSDADHIELLRLTFDEQDKPMLEAVQSRMGVADLWDLDPVLLRNDAGGVRVRRRLSALIKAESTTEAAQAQAVTSSCAASAADEALESLRSKVADSNRDDLADGP